MVNPQIAKVAVPLPIDRLFDYYIPKRLLNRVKKGMRVSVRFNNKITNGYVIGLAAKSKFPKLSPVLNAIDKEPAFTDTSLRLAESIKNYYACSIGEIVETMLPHALKHSKNIGPIKRNKHTHPKISKKGEVTYIQSYSGVDTLNYLKDEISTRVKENKRVIFVVPENRMIGPTKTFFENIGDIKIGVFHGKLSKKDTLNLWNDLSQDLIDLVIGTRSCIFTPVKNLDLIVLHGGSDYSYKEDQVPYYHAVKVATLRSNIQNCDVILSSQVPSIETYQLISQKKIVSKKLNGLKTLAKIQFTGINFKEKVDKVLEGQLEGALEKKERILVLLDRKGFATSIYCKKCNETLRCNRCSCNLRYEYTQKSLICPRCEHKTEALEICPKCNSNYIKFRGLGIEKLESNIKRLFPSTRIISIDELKKKSEQEDKYDVIISTRKILNYDMSKFDITIAWDFDSLLNVGDFRSGEHAYQLLAGLLLKTNKKMIICSSLNPDYYLFKCLENLDYEKFYEYELKSRKSLKLPPYYHIGLVSIRSFDKEKANKVSLKILSSLNKIKERDIEISQHDVPARSKIRGKYYSYLQIKSKKVSTLNKAVKKTVNKYKSGDVIITVNIDPI